jgi:hypothetical protein
VLNAIQGCLIPELDARIPDCQRLLSVLDGQEEWTIPERTQADATFVMLDGPTAIQKEAPANPASMDTLSPAQESSDGKGHWVLLAIIVLFSALGIWSIKHGATVERARLFPTVEEGTVDGGLADSVEAEDAVAVTEEETKEQPAEAGAPLPTPVTPLPTPVATPPTPVAPLPTPVAKTGFRLVGSHRVFLSKRGARYSAGEVPVGTYTIQVSFDEGPLRYGGNATIQEGVMSEITCDSQTLACKVSP